MVNNQFHQCASPDSAFQRLHGGGRALENLRMVGFWLSHLYHLCWSMRLCRLQVNVLIFWCGDFEWVFMPSSSPVLTVLDSQENERDEEWLGKNAEKTIVPPFVPSTGPPISIRYPLKAALWEKKRERISWFFIGCASTILQGMRAPHETAVHGPSPCPSTLILMADWIWLNHAHWFYCFPLTC